MTLGALRTVYHVWTQASALTVAQLVAMRSRTVVHRRYRLAKVFISSQRIIWNVIVAVSFIKLRLNK